MEELEENYRKSEHLTQICFEKYPDITCHGCNGINIFVFKEIIFRYDESSMFWVKCKDCICQDTIEGRVLI